MSVKILIRRRLKPDALPDAAAMLIKARTNAMGNRGYISTETLVNDDDPQDVMILSMWQSREDWQAYRQSDTRRAHEEKYAGLFEGAAQYEVFRVGM